MKYGYLPAPDPSTGQLQAWTSVTSAVKAMQRFAGLKDTGILGECFLSQYVLLPLKKKSPSYFFLYL